MKVSYEWLQSYFDKPLPKPKSLETELSLHAFEIEDVSEIGGDYVFDVDVLPNRSHDCLSHRGIAKEISVITNIKLKEDSLRNNLKKLPISTALSVSIEDQKLCRRFSAAVVRGVNVGSSPEWLKKRIEVIGQKSINNIVDATNYVMFNMGQPLHAYDMDKLSGKNGKYNITIRTGKKGERITTLDELDYEVDEDILLITDGNSKEAIGIAGVKGGKSAEVNDNTKNIIVESANFDPVSVRKTSQKLKLRTDASLRFENEPSQNLPYYGLVEAVELIQRIAGGDVEGHIDEYPMQEKPYKVGVSVSEINNLLGFNIKEKEVESILERFVFEYKKVKPIDKILELAPKYIGTPYKYSSSLAYGGTETFDCSSFVRHLFIEGGLGIPRVSIDQFVYGEEVDEKEARAGDVIFSVGDDKDKIHYKTILFMPGTEVKGGISHCGVYLGDGKVIHASGKDSKGEVVTEELKDSKNFKNIVGYRRMLKDNEKRFVVTVPFERMDIRIKEDLIEEIGRIYGYENLKAKTPSKTEESVKKNKKFYYIEKIRNFLTQKGFSEIYTRTFRNKGKVELSNALASDKSFLRENLKDAMTESLELNIKNADLLGLSKIKLFEFGTIFEKDEEDIHLAIGVGRVNEKREKDDNKLVDIIKELSELFNVNIKDKIRDGIIEINFNLFIKDLQEPNKYETFVKDTDEQKKYKPFSQYPFVLRDIAVFVPNKVKDEDIRDIIEREGGELLKTIMLFDVFEPALPAGRKGGQISYAFKLVFQSHEKTLLDEEINKIMNSIMSSLNKNSEWKVR